MSKFLLSGVSEVHHKQCQDGCSNTEGDMLKCMNLSAIGKKPCKNVIHVVCAGYDPSIVPHLTSFYCTDCTTGNEVLHQQMTEIEESAKKAAENQSMAGFVSKEEFDELKNIAEKLEAQLKSKMDMIEQQKAVNQQLTTTIENQKKVSDKQVADMKLLQEAVSKLEAANKKSTKSSYPATSKRMSSTLIERFNETLQQSSNVDNKSKINQSSTTRNDSINMSSIANSALDPSSTNNGWPDYEEQQRAASRQDEHSLLLVRASLAKPIPFDGDVTKWATFLSDFVRTSVRGHFRDFEDMDRLRELIVGEAREMFTTELSDPCAEALPTLKRFDEFFGVRGSAVRVALDRITQLQRVDKASDKQRLKNLYTHAKQFVLQCRIHSQEHELTAESILYILESKMFADHVKGWRTWVKNNDKNEDVEGVIAFLEETIRDLSFRSLKPKPTAQANVNLIDVTGGPEDGPSQQKSNKSKSPERPRKKGKKGKQIR